MASFLALKLEHWVATPIFFSFFFSLLLHDCVRSLRCLYPQRAPIIGIIPPTSVAALGWPPRSFSHFRVSLTLEAHHSWHHSLYIRCSTRSQPHFF